MCEVNLIRITHRSTNTLYILINWKTQNKNIAQSDILKGKNKLAM